MIHDTVLIDPSAKIGNNVEIGPYTIIGANVEIGDSNKIGPSVFIKGPTRIGNENHIFQFSSIGEDPQDKKYHGEENSRLEIGDRNTIREFCTINRGTDDGGGTTSVGNDNWIMAYTHIAHDCIVGNNTIFANNAGIAGHVRIEDNVTLGGFTGVHQFCKIGRHSLIAGHSYVVKDVPPYLIVAGNTAKTGGINKEGLKRQGFAPEIIDALWQAYKIVYKKGLILSEAIEQLGPLRSQFSEVSDFVVFIESATRGITR